MKRTPILSGLAILVAMQVFGQTVVWDAIWDSGQTDARLMSALWWTWTIIQLALAIPVGIHLARWGFARFVKPRVADRLPAAWVNRMAAPRSNSHPRSGPGSAMLSS